MNEQPSLSSSRSSHLEGQQPQQKPCTGRTTASGGLERDNSNLRQKLHELREEKSRLISENHSLVSEVEEVRFELHRTVGQLKLMQEAAEKYRIRAEELNRALVEAKTSDELRESERRDWENRYKNCSLQLTESNSLIHHQTETLLSLKQELSDLLDSKKGAKANRDTALAAAEQMRQSFVDFQNRLQSRLSSTEDQLSSSYDEREKLLADLVKRCLEIENLQKLQEQLRTEIATERSLRQLAETQNSELLIQLRDYTPQVEKIEADMKSYELLKNENQDLKVALEEKSQKMKSYEAELRENRMQLADLELLAQKLQRNILTSLKSSEISEAVGVQSVVLAEDAEADGRQLENAAVLEELRSKLVLAEKELQELRQKNASGNNNGGSQALNGACSEMQEMGGVFQLESRMSIDNWEASVQKLEEERQQQVALIASLERKIADLEVVKVSLDAQLTQRNSQIDEIQREMHEQSVKATMTERALRRTTLQTAALERQLDEKSAQVATLVSQVDDLEESLRMKSDELKKLEKQMEQRVEEDVRNCEVTKQMSEKRCRELKGQLETAESKHRATVHQLDQVERRSMSLQQTLNEMNIVMNTLRQEVQQSARLLHEQKEQSDKKIQHLDSVVQQSKEALKAATAKLQNAEEQHGIEFSNVAKRVSHLEEEIRKMTEAVEEKNDCLEMMEKELKEKQAMLLESSARIEDLEGLQNRLRREKEEREQTLCQETLGLKVLLESMEKKLNTATMDIERREQQVNDLAKTIRDLQLEKKKVIDELGNELKDTLKQLKHEKRENERQSAELVSLQREGKHLAELLKEKEESTKGLQLQLSNRDAELQEKSQAMKDLFAEHEKLKLEDEAKDRRLTEMDSRLRGREAEFEQCRDQLESLRQEMRRCRDELCSRQNAVDELNQELEQRQWDLQQKAAQVTQLDMAMKEHMAESEQRVVRLEAALKKSQLEMNQQGRQSNDLTQQTKTLMAALRQKSQLVHELEQVIRQLKAELDAERDRAHSQSTVIEAMGLERQGLELTNRRLQEELTKASDQLQTLQERLDNSEQRLVATEAEFDRTTKALADARNSLQSQKMEMQKLLEALAKADEDQTGLSEHLKRSEKEYQLLNDQLTSELAQLRNTHVAAQSGLEEELASQQQKLKATEEHQQQLMLELKRTSQQVSSLQMELDATRMIASATKETSLIKDAEIARLKARISSMSRSQLTAARETGSVTEPSNVTNGSLGQEQMEMGSLDFLLSSERVQGQCPLDGLGNQLDTLLKNDLAMAAKDLSFSSAAATGNSTQVGTGKFSAASSSKPVHSSTWENSVISSAEHELFKVRSMSEDVAPRSSAMPCLESYFAIDDDNPDSLQAMWNELQMGQVNAPLVGLPHSCTDSNRRHLQDRSCSNTSNGGATTSTGTCDPRRSGTAAAAATTQRSDPLRLGGIVEEKLRIQNRIKALIGYKEPARKTSSKSSVSSDSTVKSSISSSSTCRVSCRQPKLRRAGANSRGDRVETAVSHFGKSLNSVECRIQNERQMEMSEDTDCSLST